MSKDLQDFSAVAGAIYEAALDAATWDDALLRFVSTYAPPHWDVAFLLWERAPQTGARFVAAANLAPHARELYAATFAGSNPWSIRIAQQPVGLVVDTDDICPRADFVESGLYKHFLSAWSLTRALASILDRDGEDRLAWVIPGPDGQDIARLYRGMRLAAPHLQRAVRINRRIAESDLRAVAAESALSFSKAGVIALRDDLSIVNANARAHAFVEEGAARIQGGRWRFASAQAQAELERLAAAAAPASSAFNATTADGDEHAVIAVRIATQRVTALDGFVDGASILLTLAPKSKAPTIPVDYLSSWYGLTPSEALLAAAIADGETVRDFAIRRGVTENAVRFLMKGVLRKTHAADQARLVAALRALPHYDLSVTPLQSP
jgi:DNA-binding CsgD family transcriptional regulator